MIQKKTGKEIGLMVHFGEESGSVTVGYAIVPSEQGKGYGTEALQLMVDYLFLSKQVNRVKANTDPENLTSQRLLEKVGLKQEARTRKSSFLRGEWRDEYRCICSERNGKNRGCSQNQSDNKCEWNIQG